MDGKTQILHPRIGRRSILRYNHLLRPEQSRRPGRATPLAASQLQTPKQTSPIKEPSEAKLQECHTIGPKLYTIPQEDKEQKYEIYKSKLYTVPQSSNEDMEQEHQVNSTKLCTVQQTTKALSAMRFGPAQCNHLSYHGNTKTQECRSIPFESSKLASKKGSSGKAITLTTNYFRLEKVPDWCLYQYRVDFSPEEDRNEIKKLMIRENKEALGSYLFDGTVLFTSKKYDVQTFVLFANNANQKTTIRLRLVGRVESTDYHYIHLYNLLMRLCLEALDLHLVGRYYYESAARIPLANHRLELWPGYITSIRQHEQDILLCTEVTHKVMRMDTVYDLFTSLCQTVPQQDLRAAFEKHVLGTVVITDYNNRTYRIDDIDYNVSAASHFICGNSNMSYVEYYKSKYDISIKDLNQPMLVSLPKERKRIRGCSSSVYLVPELCRMTGLSNQMRANFPLMRDLADSTRMSPSLRMERLKRFNNQLYGNSKIVDELDSWNMKLQKSLVVLPGRVLPNERIFGGNKRSCIPGPSNDWTREMRSMSMLTTAEVSSWVVIVPQDYMRDVSLFITNLRHAALSMDMRFPEPLYRKLKDEKLSTYVEAIDSCVVADNPSILLVVLPNNSPSRYGAIKKRCLAERIVPTQLILHKSVCSKNPMSVATKVAIQMNCKLGGAPWTVEIPLKGLMVVGFDVYHESSKQKASIGVMVASLDRYLSRYFSVVTYHHTGEELSNVFSSCVCKAVRRYKQHNGALPTKIVVYRDGVGEGQISYVLEHEVEHLQSQLSKLYNEQESHMAFIIVTKRINTRLFYGNHNPPSGTVVDDVITLPDRYDFYLISQSVRQGTVSPTSYHVVHNNVGLDADKIQRLTFKLTHLYYNWSGTVRVPAPVQYAHKLAYLIGQATHKLPSEKMEEQLYFL